MCEVGNCNVITVRFANNLEVRWDLSAESEVGHVGQIDNSLSLRPSYFRLGQLILVVASLLSDLIQWRWKRATSLWMERK